MELKWDEDQLIVVKGRE